MRKALVLVCGCWTGTTSSPTIANRPPPPPVAEAPKPAQEPKPVAKPAAPVAATPPAGTGGTTYGGATLVQGGAFSSLTGTGDISSGFDDANVYGGLLGNVQLVTPLEPKLATANLDKKTVRDLVTRNIGKVENCYVEQLNTKPKLSGKLTVKFTIEGSGTVTKADASGVDKALESCVETAMTTIAFPKAKNGKPTVVTYPFKLQGDFYGGVGLVGVGAGGGGTGWGTIGTGRYGTIGSGSGYGVGSGRGGLGKSVPSVSIGHPATNDTNLDKAIIRRYVKRNIQKIRYCYEKELLNDPKLAGTITAKFTIEADGTVTAASASGMGNTTVEDCIAKTMSSILFPRPRDGNGLTVSYPFTFRPAD